MNISITQYPQLDSSNELRSQIIKLQSTAWPLPEDTRIEDLIWPEDSSLHNTSFVIMDNGSAICQVSIFFKTIEHKNNTYKAYGLGEVVTHPDYMKKGLGSMLLKEASKYMQSSSPDIVLFTCAPSLISFYEKGGWECMRSTCIVGGTLEQPFRSDTLGLASMMGFYSEFAKAHKEDFKNCDVFLKLKERKIW